MNDKALVLAPRSSVAERVATLVVVLIPFLGLIYAIWLSWGWGFGWLELSLLVGMYVATGLGVTVGFHRLFTHRAFETVRPVKFALAVLGSMSVQGPILKWAAIHRRHHQYSDEDGDPHSPHSHGEGARAVLAGFWYSHLGWMFSANHPNLDRYVGDLHSDKFIRRLSELFIVWVFVGLLIPATIGGLVTGTWNGALLGFLWGGLVRVFVVQHATFSINSICHLWGNRDFNTRDESRNNAFFGYLGLGEGWHNNHHAFPSSARHGLSWVQFDLSYVFIKLLERVGLAWKVQRPSPEAMAAKRVALPANAPHPAPAPVPVLDQAKTVATDLAEQAARLVSLEPECQG